jgi:hypothetical protein
MATVETSFEFLQWQEKYNKEKPYEVFIPLSTFSDSNVPRSNLAFETRQVRIRDARGDESGFALDTTGFEFVKCPIAMHNLKNRQVVSDIYIPEMEKFLQSYIQPDNPQDVRTLCFDLRVSEDVL